MNDGLNGKKILLFVPRGGGIFGLGISKEIERRGGSVITYDERPSQSAAVKIAIRLFKKFYSGIFRRYIQSVIAENKGTAFDYVLVIRGEAFTPFTVAMLREAFPHAEFILYMWDSITSTDTRAIFSSFDRLLSFDTEDVKTYPQFKLRPLFYLPEYEKTPDIPADAEYDVIFFGTTHGDRYKVISDVEKILKAKGRKLFLYFYFPNRILYYRKKLFDPSFCQAKMCDFHFKTIPAAEISEYLKRSMASIDLQSGNQSGLTMRTIEMLGARRKLMTSNKAVMEYDFYDPANILVFDRNDPQIPDDFLDIPYNPVPPEILERYSIRSWVNDIFNIKNE